MGNSSQPLKIDAAPATDLRHRILQLAGDFADAEHGRGEFEPGVTPVPASGKTLGREEMQALVDASLDFWLTAGRYNDVFEERLAAFVGVEHALTTNSGSSANLLAVAALCSPQLGERALRPGDEVITVAAGFPTTVNPLLLYGLVPVFVDVALPTYNICPDRIEAAITSRTRAIVLAHTLGNPFDLEVVTRIARKHDLWLVEDCCDALGSGYAPVRSDDEDSHLRAPAQRVGTFGDIATISFYPAHHITTGEGGAVLTQDPLLQRIIASIRDWGRDCYCGPAQENTCGKRFGWQLGDLPCGYDHKYTYSNLGFNLKMTDMQAAIGVAQLERLEGFVAARRRHFAYLSDRFAGMQEFLVLPEATAHSVPSWFGFPITLRPEAQLYRADLLTYLDQYRIGTRLLFAGNITRQPYFSNQKFRVSGTLETTDRIMNDTLWIGVHPGLSEPMLDFMAEKIGLFLGFGL